MPVALTWVDAAKGVGDIVQALALVVGAVWAYFKFVHGRTFAYRGELSISGERVGSSSLRAVRARVVFANTGASQILLSPVAKIVTLSAAPASAWKTGGTIEWQELGAYPVFAKHAWVEPQEPITEELLLPVSDTLSAEPILAYQLECVIGSKRRRGKAMKWTAQALVLDPSHRTNESAYGDDDRKGPLEGMPAASR